MEFIDIKDLNPKLILSTPIGIGFSAICYKTRDNKVYKLYYNKYFRKIMRDRVENISKVGDDTFIAPQTGIIKNGEFIGYIYPFIEGETLKKSIKKQPLHLYRECYPQLIAKTKEFSKSLFILEDLNSRNIIFNNNFFIIDLDRGHFPEYIKTPEKAYERNILHLNKNIISAMFGLNEDEVLIFQNNKLQKAYIDATFHEAEAIYALFDLFEQINEDEPIIKLHHKVHYIKEYNSYYKY